MKNSSPASHSATFKDSGVAKLVYNRHQFLLYHLTIIHMVNRVIFVALILFMLWHNIPLSGIDTICLFSIPVIVALFIHLKWQKDARLTILRLYALEELVAVNSPEEWTDFFIKVKHAEIFPEFQYKKIQESNGITSIIAFESVAWFVLVALVTIIKVRLVFFY
jgi:hypothetical protein